jgi:hypothetical protein
MMKYKMKELKARQQHELRMVRSHAAGTDTGIGSFDTPTPTATHSYSYSAGSQYNSSEPRDFSDFDFDFDYTGDYTSNAVAGPSNMVESGPSNAVAGPSNVDYATFHTSTPGV